MFTVLTDIETYKDEKFGTADQNANLDKIYKIIIINFTKFNNKYIKFIHLKNISCDIRDFRKKKFATNRSKNKSYWNNINSRH